MDALRRAVAELARSGSFSGVVRVDDGNELRFVDAYGFADRRWRIPNRPDTRFGLASGTKGITALTVVSLIEEHTLSLTTRARELLGDDLPLIRDDVTVEHLLAHRSGIGDYYDEEVHTDVNAYVMPVPAQQLDSTEAYLAVLDGYETKFAPGERFQYCNSGFVVLALIAERASGVPFDELVLDRVCGPAGMRDTAFFRSDELPEHVAMSYLDATGLRTNVFHLPVRGSGDGGIYATAADVQALWQALRSGAIVDRRWVEEMVRPRSTTNAHRYGLGIWLGAVSPIVFLDGMDAGVSFQSWHDPRSNVTTTVVSNTSEGAWPIARHLREHAFDDAGAT